MATLSSSSTAARRVRRRPLRVTVVVPPRLAEVLDGLALLCGQSPAQTARSLVAASLVEARHDPAVQAALAARQDRVRLRAIDGRP